MTRDSPYEIRFFDRWADYKAAEELQHAVWRMSDYREVVPASLLITIQKNGGIVQGAFDGNGALAGFVFGFRGTDQYDGAPIPKLCSHMLGVHPERRGKGIGERLKWAQRQAALDQGLRLITWTYDPLQAVNGSLNIACLGAIARRYIADAYGDMSDGLNAGVPSDRFEVEWWLDSARVRERCDSNRPAMTWAELQASGAEPIFEVERADPARPRVIRVLVPAAPRVFLEIPPSLGTLKSSDLQLASEWRSRTRQALTGLFSAGYVVDDFVFESIDGGARAGYRLSVGKPQD